jgi:hypothetical protein
MIRIAILYVVFLLSLSFEAAAQVFNAPPVLSNFTIAQVSEDQPISVSINVTPNQNLIGSVSITARADGIGTTAFSGISNLQRVGTSNVFQGSISGRPYGGYTLRATVRFKRIANLLTNLPWQVTATNKTIIVSAGPNCFAFDQAGFNEGWTGDSFHITGTNSTFGTCNSNPLYDSQGNWPFNVANSGRGGLSNSNPIDNCNPNGTQVDTAFWHTAYISPDLTNRPEFQGVAEIVVRIRSRDVSILTATRPFIQLQASRPTGDPRVPRNGVGSPIFLRLNENFNSPVTANGQLINTFDQATGWNVIRWRPLPALMETVTGLRVVYVDTFGAIRAASQTNNLTLRLPQIDGVCALH